MGYLERGPVHMYNYIFRFLILCTRKETLYIMSYIHASINVHYVSLYVYNGSRCDKMRIGSSF